MANGDLFALSVGAHWATPDPGYRAEQVQQCTAEGELLVVIQQNSDIYTFLFFSQPPVLVNILSLGDTW